MTGKVPFDMRRLGVRDSGTTRTLGIPVCKNSYIVSTSNALQVVSFGS